MAYYIKTATSNYFDHLGSYLYKKNCPDLIEYFIEDCIFLFIETKLEHYGSGGTGIFFYCPKESFGADFLEDN